MFNMDFMKDKNILSEFKLSGFCVFIFFALAIALLLSSKFLSQDLIDSGISKKEVIAKKTIEVVDTQKTEMLRRDFVKRIKPVMVPVDSNRVLSAFHTLKESLMAVKTDNSDKQAQYVEFSNLLDIPNSEKKEAAVNFALNTSKNGLAAILQSSEIVLSKYLKQGLQESEIEAYTNSDEIKKTLGTSLSSGQMSAVSAILECVLMPNLIIDDFATDVAKKNAKNLVKPYTVTFYKGDTILKPDEPVTQVKRDALKKSGYGALEMNKSAIIGIFLYTLLCSAVLVMSIKYRQKKYDDPRYYMILGILSVILSLICVKISSNNDISNYLMPIPAFSIILAIFTTPALSFVATVIFIALISTTLFLEPQFISVFVFAALASVYFVSKISYTRRMDLVSCGFWTGIIMSIFIVVTAVFESQFSVNTLMSDACFALLNGIVSGACAFVIIPFFEIIFKTITPYRLIELADHNSPILSELQCKAPGTYHHSLMVANLCEAAAEAIGADSILARVGAFYHDIGKLQKPLFFIENQSYFGVENPHNKLNPRLSKMVIISHTKDGVEYAKKKGLPQEIINFIQQHHGEALAGHFYNQAVQLEGKENVQQDQFRYSGPKPNMKETAILMLADAVESAVRSLKNPSMDEIENMINKIITERLNDGQLSDSPLTLKDIKLIAITFNRILRGMQHDRVKYQQGVMNELDDGKIVIGQSEEEKLEKKIQKKIEENKDKEIKPAKPKEEDENKDSN